MNEKDKRLGMASAISRRDFINGVSVAIGVSALPGCSKSDDTNFGSLSVDYPPLSTGMRGAHAGSFEFAHAAVRGKQWETENIGEHYDLIVVGAGISGLSAAYIHRRDVNPDARILILDNHDDFGGHAKRNEFLLDDKTYVAYGGTMMMEAASAYPAVSSRVIKELGIDVNRFSEEPHRQLLKSYGCGPVTFFDKGTFGKDFLARGGFWYSDAMQGAPLSSEAKEQLKRLTDDTVDYLAGKTAIERREIIESLSWREYLKSHAGMGEEVLAYVQKYSHGVWAIGADALPAKIAWAESYPGFAGMDLGYTDDELEASEGGEVYFPDGNASVARLLVRKLNPAIAAGDSMADIVSARFDYSAFDRPGKAPRIRLNSTVVDLRHLGPGRTGDVAVTYVKGNKAKTVTAAKVVWAGYHAMLPYICPDIPEQQSVAHRSSVRAPLSYTNVLIRNWHSLAKSGMRRAYCPGSFFQTVMISHQVTLDDYQPSQSPDDPVVLHLQHIPLAPELATTPEQFRAGRKALFRTSFETFERNIRHQLASMLGPAGFDPAKDIAGITVNRWPHGYAYSTDIDSGDVAWYPEDWQHGNRPWVTARTRVGNIAFAGTDASSNAMTESAIEEAYRAVHSFGKT
ncbi:MAG: NAD(P)-binding protein [Pseudomonadota bacterium]